jgi:hypothetical protein
VRINSVEGYFVNRCLTGFPAAGSVGESANVSHVLPPGCTVGCIEIAIGRQAKKALHVAYRKDISDLRAALARNFPLGGNRKFPARRADAAPYRRSSPSVEPGDANRPIRSAIETTSAND